LAKLLVDLSYSLVLSFQIFDNALLVG